MWSAVLVNAVKMKGNGDEKMKGGRGVKYMGEGKMGKNRVMVCSVRMKMWIMRAITLLLLWTCTAQLTAIGEVWGSKLMKSWPSQLNISHPHVQQKPFLHPNSEPLCLYLLSTLKLFDLKFLLYCLQECTRTMGTLWFLVMVGLIKCEQR